MDVYGFNINDIYKLLSSRLTPTAIPVFPLLRLNPGKFNYQHTDCVVTSRQTEIAWLAG